MTMGCDQPEDWDDEEDGEWKSPTVPNPEYKGPWKPKVYSLAGFFFVLLRHKLRASVKYLLLWELQKLKNPAYKGKWKAPLIDNPGKFLFAE